MNQDKEKSPEECPMTIELHAISLCLVDLLGIDTGRLE
jgi:hypothetical protein